MKSTCKFSISQGHQVYNQKFMQYYSIYTSNWQHLFHMYFFQINILSQSTRLVNNVYSLANS